jgi:hypothetical protein
VIFIKIEIVPWLKFHQKLNGTQRQHQSHCAVCPIIKFLIFFLRIKNIKNIFFSKIKNKNFRGPATPKWPRDDWPPPLAMGWPGHLHLASSNE